MNGPKLQAQSISCPIISDRSFVIMVGMIETPLEYHTHCTAYRVLEYGFIYMRAAQWPAVNTESLKFETFESDSYHGWVFH